VIVGGGPETGEGGHRVAYSLRPMRVHFVNENIGGHATMHQAIRLALREHPDVEATFYDAPPPTFARRLLSARIPGLPPGSDFQALRDQLVRSGVVARHLLRAPVPDVLHVYTHNVALLSAKRLHEQHAVVSLDATNLQNAYRLPHQRAGRMTPVMLRPTMALERRVYAAATLVVAQSEWAAKSLREDYGVQASRVRTIPFGIAVPEERERVEDEGLPRITFIGRSMERKGGSRLLRLWRERLSTKSRLTLVTLEDVSEEPGLEVFNDIRPGDGRVDEVLASTAVFAFPTELDTFGYAAVEAMAASVPVVATDTAALGEVIDDGVTGLLVPPGDDGALVDALERLLADEALRRAMGDAGRRRVLERFDARVTTTALLDVLREATGQRTTETPPHRGR
jgi:starch synthase